MTGQYWIIDPLVLNIAKWLDINNLKDGKDAGPDNIRYNKVLKIWWHHTQLKTIYNFY